MYLVDGRDLIDAETVDDRHAQETAVARRQSDERDSHRELAETLMREAPEVAGVALSVRNQPMRVLAAEIIREKLLQKTRDELPFAVAVGIDSFNGHIDPLFVGYIVLAAVGYAIAPAVAARGSPPRRRASASPCASRWRRRHPALPMEEAGEIASGKDPADSAESNERGKAVRTAVASLPADLRESLILGEYEGLSHAEIAAIAGCSPKAVERRISRARHILRGQLSRYLQG